jgi:hypothetical protein
MPSARRSWRIQSHSPTLKRLPSFSPSLRPANARWASSCRLCLSSHSSTSSFALEHPGVYSASLVVLSHASFLYCFSHASLMFKTQHFAMSPYRFRFTACPEFERGFASLANCHGDSGRVAVHSTRAERLALAPVRLGSKARIPSQRSDLFPAAGLWDFGS